MLVIVNMSQQERGRQLKCHNNPEFQRFCVSWQARKQISWLQYMTNPTSLELCAGAIYETYALSC
jgi:hypothetical protein